MLIALLCFVFLSLRTMKNQSIIIVFLGIVLLGGLAVWQILFLTKTQSLKQEVEEKQKSGILLESAISLRKLESLKPEIRENTTLKRELVDSILKENYSGFYGTVVWGFFNGEGDPIDSLNAEITTNTLAHSPFKICISCLTTIDVVDDTGESTVDEGFVLNQTPGQMMNIRGMNKKELKYLHVDFEKSEVDYRAYFLPILFLVGLIGLFAWLLRTNAKQTRLINQKDEFVNHLSHQFQTPLSSIKLSANLLTNKDVLNKDELVKIIQTESNRLENHIKTVLHWVKSDADRLQIQKKPIGVTHVIEQALKQMKPIFLENKATVRFIPPSEDLMIHADEGHLQLMLYNIWDNAIKHNEKPVSIVISCAASIGMVQIMSRDDGIGIQAAKTNLGYKGLGLAYIERIMKAHGGLMDLISGKDGLQVILNFPKYE